VISDAFEGTGQRIPSKAEVLGSSQPLSGTTVVPPTTGAFQTSPNLQLTAPYVPVYLDSGGKRTTVSN
jgi:hypothetical protein